MSDEGPVLDEGQNWIELGKRLRESREYMGLSQGEVAEHLSLSRPAITNIESGRRKVSTLELTRLARLYHRSYEYFLGEESGPPEDEAASALYRAARGLSDHDKEQVLRFAEFLQNAGPAPSLKDGDR